MWNFLMGFIGRSWCWEWRLLMGMIWIGLCGIKFMEFWLCSVWFVMIMIWILNDVIIWYFCWRSIMLIVLRRWWFCIFICWDCVLCTCWMGWIGCSRREILLVQFGEVMFWCCFGMRSYRSMWFMEGCTMWWRWVIWMWINGLWSIICFSCLDGFWNVWSIGSKVKIWLCGLIWCVFLCLVFCTIWMMCSMCWFILGWGVIIVGWCWCFIWLWIWRIWNWFIVMMGWIGSIICMGFGLLCVEERRCGMCFRWIWLFYCFVLVISIIFFMVVRIFIMIGILWVVFRVWKCLRLSWWLISWTKCWVWLCWGWMDLFCSMWVFGRVSFVLFYSFL